MIPIDPDELFEAANATLNRLGPMASRAFEARFVEEMTWEHIAALEDISTATAERIYEEACEGMRRSFG